MRVSRFMAHLGGLGLTVLMASPASYAADDAAASTGSRLTGSVKYTGKAPEPRSLPVTKDRDVCGKDPKADESLLVGKKGELANVVVVVEGVKSSTTLSAPKTAAIAQERCRYSPHVQVVAAGGSVKITNGDATLHTVHAYKDRVTLFNDVTATAGSQATEVLDDPGPVAFKCDAGHTWMSAWIYVVTQPYYAVTGTDGTFAIDGLPLGTYTVRTWHETLGTTTNTVKIVAGKAPKLQVSYK